MSHGRHTRHDLASRIGYAVAGLVSSFVILVFIWYPVWGFILEISGDIEMEFGWWMIVLPPLGLSFGFGVWGFISGEGMLRYLGRIWDGCFGHHTGF